MRTILFVVLSAIVVGYSFDWYLPFQVSTILMILIAALVFRRYGLISLPTIVYTIMFFPALSPFVANTIMKVSYYTGYSYALQTDFILINKVLSLFLMACLSFVVICGRQSVRSHRPLGGHIIYGRAEVVMLLSAVTLVSAFLTEPGETLLTGSYADLRGGALRASVWHIIGVQILQVSWIFLFLLGRHKKTIFWGTTIVVLVWLFLHSRRIELIGMVLCLMLWLRFKISPRRVLLIGIVTFILMAALPVFRNASWIAGDFGHVGIQSFFHYGEIKRGTRFKLPGGAPSTIFMTTVQLVNEKDTGKLDFFQSKTMFAWIARLVPTPLAEGFGIKLPELESHSIFKAHNIPYNGSMHLLGAIYINGGVLLVMLYGLLLGVASAKGEEVLLTYMPRLYAAGGCGALFLTYIFVINQLRFQWYHPTPLFKLLIYSAIALFIMDTGLKYRKRSVSM